MAHAYKHLVFDCDGVLWQGTNDGYFQCYHRAAVEAGIELDFEVARQRILVNWGKSAQLEVEGMIPEHPALVPVVVRRYRELVRSDFFLDTAVLVPGAKETLCELSGSYRLSALTGMNTQNLTRLFQRFHLYPHFRHVISTDDTEDPDKQKASGYHLRQLMQHEGLKPHEALCVGDAATDVQMAKSQGVDVVAVLTGHLSEEEARALYVTAILVTINDLPEWLSAQALNADCERNS